MLCDTATVAGVFTRSDTAAAPVIRSRNVVASGRAGAILTNAGNANAFTGERGHDTVLQISAALASELGISADQILLASTGVIGEPLETARLSAYFPQLVANQGAIWEQAAEAILTTDTFPKAHITRTLRRNCKYLRHRQRVWHDRSKHGRAWLRNDATIPANVFRVF